MKDYPTKKLEEIIDILDNLRKSVLKIQTLQSYTERELKLLEKSVLNRAFVI